MKTSKFIAALTSVVLAAANTATFQPFLSATAAGESTTAAAEEAKGNCTAKISVVDMDTGKSIEGINVTLEYNPNASGKILGEWNTADEPVKEYTGLYAKADYGITLKNIPSDYYIPEWNFFSVDNDGETEDVVLRAVKKDAALNVQFVTEDWSKAVPSENNSFLEGITPYDGMYSVFVYDENGKYFTRDSFCGNSSMHLPEGKYTLEVKSEKKDYEIITTDFDIAGTASEIFSDIVFPDKDKRLELDVKNINTETKVELFFRLDEAVASIPDNNCKLKVSVVDVDTGEPVKGIKAKLIQNPNATGKKVAEWDTADEPVKAFDNLYPKIYYNVQLNNIPDDYTIDRNNYFNFNKNGDQMELYIRAVPKDKKPNVNIAVYDWTDLEVDPATHLYEGYKIMDPDDYDLIIYAGKFGPINITRQDIYLPDGKYYVQAIDKTGDYSPVDNEGGKARAIHKLFGQDFVIPDGIAMEIEIKDGYTVGQPCLFFERDSKKKINCELTVNIVDGQTGKPVSAPECELLRVAEALEDNAENLLYDELIIDGLFYIPEEKDGTFTFTGLEPGVKYAIIGASGNKKYGSGKPVFKTFAEDGEKDEITITLYPYDFNEGCSMTISIPDAETGKTADGAEYKVVYLSSFPRDMLGTVTAKDILEKGTVIEKGKMPKDADSVTVSGLKCNSWYAVIAESGSNRYGMPRAVLVVFGDNGDTENVVLKLYPAASDKPCSLNVQIIDGVTEKPAFAEFKVIRIPDELAAKADELDIITLDSMGVICGLGGISDENSNVEIKNLEADTKYAVFPTNYLRMYSGVKPVIVSFDEAGQTKDVTIKLYPFNYNDCSASIDAVDIFKKERVTNLEIRLYRLSEDMGLSPDRAEIFEKGTLVKSFRPSDDTVGVFLDLEPYARYAAVVDSYSIAYNCPAPEIFSFSGSEKTKHITIEMVRNGYTTNYGDANCDNVKDLSDAILIMQALANPNKYGINGTDPGHITKVGAKNSDVTGNDGMTPEDALAIQKYLIGLIRVLPEPTPGNDFPKGEKISDVINVLPDPEYTLSDKNGEKIK